jgi:hypothetical protein
VKAIGPQLQTNERTILSGQIGEHSQRIVIETNDVAENSKTLWTRRYIGSQNDLIAILMRIQPEWLPIS